MIYLLFSIAIRVSLSFNELILLFDFIFDIKTIKGDNRQPEDNKIDGVIVSHEK